MMMRYLTRRTSLPSVRKINDAWKEVYYQLGRNKSVPLSDDDFLRAHWIIYFRYSRKRGDDYIKFLLSKFSSKGIFEKAPVWLRQRPSRLSAMMLLMQTTRKLLKQKNRKS